MDNDYISYDNLLRDVRDYTGVLDFSNISANHENTSGVSIDPQVQKLVDKTRDLTRRCLLTPAAPLPGAASPFGRESITAKWRGSVAQNSGTFVGPRARSSKKGGAAMRSSRIHRPNVVTRRAAAELTGAVTRYRGVRPNNNNNNKHAALAERFQPSTLHKLQQLGLYNNTDTPDTAH